MHGLFLRITGTARERSGFSLVELSIVLVILGLLTGGVLAGQSLIRAAELRSVSTEYSRYVTATQSFRDRYFQFPGDINNATKFWGTLGGDGSNYTCQNLEATDARTCNGNSDGILGWPSSPVPGGTSFDQMAVASSELSRFWQHLANAGLIEGSYSGRSGDSWNTSPIMDGKNAPLSRSGAYWTPAGRTVSSWAGSATRFGKSSSNDKELTLVSLGGGASSLFVPDIALVFAPEEAWNIDTKMDDGLPNKGSVTTYKANCTTATGVAPPGDANAQYALTNRSKVCGLIFGF